VSLHTNRSHFTDTVPSQSLSIVHNKLNLTQQNQTCTSKLTDTET